MLYYNSTYSAIIDNYTSQREAFKLLAIIGREAKAGVETEHPHSQAKVEDEKQVPRGGQ
jgi:hypothetical protein